LAGLRSSLLGGALSRKVTIPVVYAQQIGDHSKKSIFVVVSFPIGEDNCPQRLNNGGAVF